MRTTINENIHRKESWDKVTGYAKYVDDLPVTKYLCARLLTSPHPHARIKSINYTEALKMEGVRAVITGQDFPVFCGPLLEDRHPLAIDIVRYAGEPVAIVVAVNEATALKAVRKIVVEYELLPTVFNPVEAFKKNAPKLHPDLAIYRRIEEDVNPIEDSNIAAKFQIRKGDIDQGFQESEIVIEEVFHLPPSDHLAMEVRSARAEISYDGKVKIETTSQSPFSVAKQISACFSIPAGNIEVHVPFVGGAFGGKAPVTLEILAYMACIKVKGEPVRLMIPREEDMATAPSRLGLDAKIKLGATKDGKIIAANLTYYLDTGAYADISPYMAKSIASNCTGPYHIENICCDSYCIYTNHTYATSFRGFGHMCYTYCIERAIDILAKKCSMDPMEMRLKNAIKPGDLTPTQVVSSFSNIGNLVLCLQKLKTAIDWKGPVITKIDEHTVRTKGIACLWKSANPPPNSISGAIITFNSDGSLNLNTGVVEMGSGGQTNLAQMLADKLKMDISKIHVVFEVNTRLNPEHYKTVASITNYMAGNAVMKAAEDILNKLKNKGAAIFSCHPDQVEIAECKVFCIDNPQNAIDFKDIVLGYQTKDGESIGEPIIAAGPFQLKGLSLLDPNTGKGRNSPSWTVGAQAVEIEWNQKDYTYRILNATTVIDVGKVINSNAMKEIVMSGMAMGISVASREIYQYNKKGRLNTPNLRTYKLLHIGQEPKYHVEFVETAQYDSPFGSRGISEHGIIGIPAALSNALSLASGLNLRELPLTPEYLWKQKENKNDCR